MGRWTGGAFAPWLGLALGLAGCAAPGGRLDFVLADRLGAPPRLEAFTHCSGHGCQRPQVTAIAPADWARIAAPLSAASDARAERDAMRRVIGDLETLLGAQTGTAGDKGGTFGGFAAAGQLDCVDEMLNTASYLHLLAEGGLLRFHTLGRRVGTVFFQASAWPHTAATVIDREGREFVIDSWLLDNGAPPYIVPVEAWLSGAWREDLAALAGGA